MSERIRDHVFVRAFALREGDVRVLLLIHDLLMVTDELYFGLSERLADTGFNVMVHATHSHSSIGGLGKGFLFRRFAGNYREGLFNHLLDCGERAGREAVDNLRPAEARAESSVLPGLNGNRRDPDGPRDEELTVLRLAREHDSAVLVSYCAHPVIVGERDHHALSADFPGEVVRGLELEFPFAAFIQGSLGGVDVLFPDDPDLDADRNLGMMADPIVGSAANLAHLAKHSPGPLAFASETWDLPRRDSRPYFDDQLLSGPLGLPLRLVANSLIPSRIKQGRVQGFRVGSFAMVGTPADLGVTIGLAAKAHARKIGISHPVTASQCDGYLGYLHRRQDYLHAPPKSHFGMAFYENAMGFFGRDMGERVLRAACSVHDRLKG